MKKSLLSKMLRYAAALSFITVVIYGCKKEFNRGSAASNLITNVFAVKSWYQSTYPVITYSGKKIQSTPSGMPDYSQFLKPDWDNAVTYSRFSKEVTEVPISPESPFSASLKNYTSGKTVYRKQDSRSSFLILKDSTGYQAFVMVLMADSAWLNGDKSKLDAQHYNKRSSDFTGLVMYFTPKGQAAGVWQYSGGQIVANNSLKSTTQIQSSGKKVNEADGNVCYDYYLVFYTNGVEDDAAMAPVFLFTTCDSGAPGNNSPSGGGGGSSSPSPSPCVPSLGSPDVQSVKQTNAIKTSQVQQDPGDGGGYPQPTNGGDAPDPCADLPPEVDDNNNVINTDCSSFVYIRTSSANWQEAGVRNIRLQWVWLGGNSSGMSRQVWIPQVVFGLPTYYTNRNGTTTSLSAGRAAVISAQLTERAKLLTYVEFRDSPYLPDDATVIQYFRTQIQLLMVTQQGTAGINGSGSSNIIFQDEERSTFFPYSCNQ